MADPEQTLDGKQCEFAVGFASCERPADGWVYLASDEQYNMACRNCGPRIANMIRGSFYREDERDQVAEIKELLQAAAIRFPGVAFRADLPGGEFYAGSVVRGVASWLTQS